MAQATLTFNVDETLKNDFYSFCGNAETKKTDANVFVTFFVNRENFPQVDYSEYSRYPEFTKPNAETLEAIEEIERMKKDRSLRKGYTDVTLMMKEALEE